MTVPLVATAFQPVQLPDGRAVDVPKAGLLLDRWQGPAVHTYGGKAIVEFEGEPLFAELAILRLLRLDGWDGVWADTFGRHFRVGLPSRVAPVRLPEPAELVYRTVATLTGGVGGCWDIFVWRGDRFRFVEAKRARKDRLRPGQAKWLEAALRAGFDLDAFLVVEWDLQLLQ